MFVNLNNFNRPLGAVIDSCSEEPLISLYSHKGGHITVKKN